MPEVNLSAVLGAGAPGGGNVAGKWRVTGGQMAGK